MIAFTYKFEIKTMGTAFSPALLLWLALN